MKRPVRTLLALLGPLLLVLLGVPALHGPAAAAAPPAGQATRYTMTAFANSSEPNRCDNFGLADANRYSFRDSCARSLRHPRHYVYALRVSPFSTPTPSAPTVPSP
ncbi:hypothetical protein E4N62_40070 [Streptomyces sp. MNU76]|uniref:hypothetical protein n=1 Tax=Streptomyces sp. MNU76 TaxID=2560026 RepID=UPI001E5D3BA1|nr:hypothetical protein [Streptomyces sp. MNU76]MCC9710890.1 hypothetical protein [Streptomyces sp. MNU76]